MKLRRFTPDGIQAFRDLLKQCREQPDVDVPTDLLEHSSFTELINPPIEVMPQQFEVKRNAAEYLGAVLRPLKPEEVEKDAGLWTWLSFFYFGSVCRFEGGKRIVRNDYQYVFEPNNPRHFYRHLLFIPWNILRLAPDHSRLFLNSKTYVLDAITADTMKRLYVTRLPCIFEVLDRLYWDEERNRVRRGVVGSTSRAGDLTHRLPLRIRQLEMTYDLMSLSADQLIELLGKEFSFARHNSTVLLDAPAEAEAIAT